MMPERFERVRRHAPEGAEPRPAGRASDLVGVWGSAPLKMDATAILDYFAPLEKWLDEQLQGKAVGW